MSLTRLPTALETELYSPVPARTRRIRKVN